jgi:hypothetical protein
MGKDASSRENYERLEPLEVVPKDGVADSIGNVAHNAKENAHSALDIVKEKAHDAAETIKWKAGEMRDGLQKSLSLEHIAGVVVPSLSPIAKEPVALSSSPIPKDLFVIVERPDAAGEIMVDPDQLKMEDDLAEARAHDLPHEKAAIICIEPMAIEEIKETPAPTPAPSIYERALEAQLALEDVGHNTRLQIENVLETQFGGHAEKIQAELEKARVSAIAGTAHLAELLQGQFRKASTYLRERRSVDTSIITPAIVTEPMEQNDTVGTQIPSENKQPVADVTQAAIEIDRAVPMKERAAHVTELLQEKFGKVASTLRDQEQHGIAPVYR